MHSRCEILLVISSIYDPLGYLSPIILPVKLILQELCKTNYSWDDEISSALDQQWIKWITSLNDPSAFKVDRCLKPHGFGQSIQGQLHHFSDASEKGYGPVTYLQNSHNATHVSFLLGKSRVTPLKPVTIPRLEITAVVLAARIDKMLRREIQLDLMESCFWTDSTYVLKYIKNENKRFCTFVANGVSIIREASEVTQWKYIHTSQNPADGVSRGMTVQKLITSKRWLNGPEFLWKPKEERSNNSIEMDISDDSDDPEVKRELTTNLAAVEDSSNSTHRLIAYFSEWRRLKVSVAWLLR